MRRLIAALFVASTLVRVACAEADASKRVTYFLIDASGSMAEEVEGSAPTVNIGQLAELKISAQLSEIQESDPGALVSRTYFRAKNRDLCWHPVRIQELVPIAQSKREAPRYEDDRTPLGAALLSAINEAGDQQADIFIVSDGIQSPDCGPDICEVARKHLPMSGIDVIPMIASGAEGGPNPLACIDEAEARPATIKVQATDDKGNEEEANSNWANTWIVRKTFVFFEKWWWLIGLISLGWSAIGIGRRESERAQILEDGSERARSYQKLIRENDSQALNDLNTMVVEVKKSLLKMGPTRSKKKNQPAEADDEKAIEDMPLRSLDRGFRIRRVIRDYPLGVFGAFTIAWIALLPNQICSVGLEGTKSAAWDALNSQFATAFAVTWIAIIFFASNQNHRRREALHQFHILTDEAKRVEAIEKREARAAAFNEYDRQLNDLKNLDFTELDDIVASIDDPVISAEVSKNVDLVKRTSLAAAAGIELGETNEPSELMRASNRLASLTQSSIWSRLDYPTFIRRLRNTRSLTDNLTEWENLEKALKYAGSEVKVERINELAETIRAN